MVLLGGPPTTAFELALGDRAVGYLQKLKFPWHLHARTAAMSSNLCANLTPAPEKTTLSYVTLTIVPGPAQGIGPAGNPPVLRSPLQISFRISSVLRGSGCQHAVMQCNVYLCVRCRRGTCRRSVPRQGSDTNPPARSRSRLIVLLDSDATQWVRPNRLYGSTVPSACPHTRDPCSRHTHLH